VKKTFGHSKWKLIELPCGSRYLAYVRCQTSNPEKEKELTTLTIHFYSKVILGKMIHIQHRKIHYKEECHKKV